MDKFKRFLPVILAALGISSSLLLFIEKEEGFGPKNKDGMYVAYSDPGYGWKVPSICNGHTRGVYKGMTATKQQCEVWLKEDLMIAQKEVAKCIKVPITQGQLDAVTSFHYNTGAACRQLAPYVNTKSCKEAAKAFNEIPQLNKDGTIKMYNGKPIIRYTTSNGIVLNGLIKRRAKEREMFEKGCK